MSILINLTIIVVGCFMLVLSIAGLKEIKRSKLSSITYGPGANKHILQHGHNISHGMVIDDSGKLVATSKKFDARQ